KSTERVFSLAFFLHPKFRAETDGKGENTHARQFSKQKMTELMDNNQHAEADDRCHNRVNYVLHPFSPSTAVRSMNKRRSGLPSPSIYFQNFIPFFRPHRHMSLHRLVNNTVDIAKAYFALQERSHRYLVRRVQDRRHRSARFQRGVRQLQRGE